MRETDEEGNRTTDKPTNIQPTKFFFGKILITINDFYFHFVGIAALGARFLGCSVLRFLCSSVSLRGNRCARSSVVLFNGFPVLHLFCFAF